MRRIMDPLRSAALFALPMAVLACNSDKGPGDNNPDDTGGPDGPLSFTFKQTLAADSYEAEVVEEAIQAHQVSTMLLASAQVVVADEKVQDRLNTDGGGGSVSSFRDASLDCWQRPDFPMFSFSIDYSTCGTYQMGGGVFVNDHPSGPLLFEFGAFRIEDREIGGVLALDTTDAYPAPLYWQAYNTEGDDPGLDNTDVKLGIKLDGELFGVGYSGGSAIDFLNQEWSMWGVMTIGIGEEVVQVVHGAATPEEVSPDEPPGGDVVKSSLNWLECRCPQSGITALEMPLRFTMVTIDIDALEDVPDVIDDPEVDIPVDFELPGRGVLTYTGCGTYDVVYDTETVQIPVTPDQIVGAISFQCATLAIDDEERCNALLAAAERLPGDVQIEVTQQAATATAIGAVEQSFDTSWCAQQ